MRRRPRSTIFPYTTLFRSKWSGRKGGPYTWYEIQDPIAYWQEFSKPKIVYQEIQFHPSYGLDRAGRLGNNKTFFIATDDLYLDRKSTRLNSSHSQISYAVF